MSKWFRRRTVGKRQWPSRFGVCRLLFWLFIYNKTITTLCQPFSFFRHFETISRSYFSAEWALLRVFVAACQRWKTYLFLLFSNWRVYSNAACRIWCHGIVGISCSYLNLILRRWIFFSKWINNRNSKFIWLTVNGNPIVQLN